MQIIDKCNKHNNNYTVILAEEVSAFVEATGLYLRESTESISEDGDDFIGLYSSVSTEQAPLPEPISEEGRFTQQSTKFETSH